VALSLMQDGWGWYGSRGHCPVRYCSGSLSNESGCRLADRACEKKQRCLWLCIQWTVTWEITALWWQRGSWWVSLETDDHLSAMS